MVTLHEVITFLVSMQISISSLQTHNVNRCGRSLHLARKLILRRKRSSPTVVEMAATETITKIIKNIWTAPLHPETELSRQMTTSTTSIDIMGLQAAYANLHTDQERDYFMQRYHDVISSFGGKTSYDADNRPLLVMRSNLWASG